MTDPADHKLIGVEIMMIRTFDDDPEGRRRVTAKVILGPEQSLALLAFLQKNEARLRAAAEPSNTHEE